jgi:O-antigen/teichoic acid export membrane protein
MQQANANSTHPSASVANLGLVLLILTFATYGLKYVVNLVLAKNMPPEVYGDLSLALRFLAIAAALTLLGTGTSAKRFLAKYLQTNRHADAASYLRWNTRLVARAYSLVCIGALLSSALMFHLHLFGIRHIESYHLAVYMLWIAPLVATGTLLAAFLLCDDLPVSSYLFSKTARYALMAAAFYLMFALVEALPSNLTIVGVLAAVWLSILVLEVVYAAFRAPRLFRHLAGLVRGLKPEPNPAKEQEWTRISRRLIINHLMFLILGSLDLMLLELLGPNEAQVGYYSAVLTIIGMVWLLPDAPLRPIKPKINTLSSSAADSSVLQRMIRQAVLFNLFTVTAVTTGIVVFGDRLLSHFGPDYVQAHEALLIGVAAAAVASVTRAGPVLLLFSDNEQTQLKITIFELSVMLCIGVVLAPGLGMVGVAWALFIAVSASSVVAAVVVRRVVRLKSLVIV